MNVPVKLAAFCALLAIVFVAALGIGRAVGPIDLHTPSHAVNGSVPTGPSPHPAMHDQVTGR